MKILEQQNPYVAGGIARYPVIRETKTQYVCVHDIRFRKPTQEQDGCLVYAVGADRWDRPYTLRITEDKPE